MKSFRILVLSAAFAGFILVVFLFRSPLAGFFRNIRISFFGAADREFTYENYENLKMRNNLLAQSCLAGAPVSEEGRYEYRSAGVFSDYPFNNYASISIDFGAEDGLKPGMPVLASAGVLIGKVKEVRRTQSEVETIFDPNWRSAVAFGPDKTKALLVGGPAPYLDLIPKGAAANPGDVIFNLAKEFPINFNLGKILSLNSDEKDVWLRAKFEPPAHFENLKKVLVITNFP